MYDFTKFQVEFFPEWIEQFRSGSKIGEYSYKKGGSTSLYGTTDMLITLYGMGELNLNKSEKDEWAETINQFQDPTSGWYKKSYTLHYKEHTTAYAVAALHLIDRKPNYPMKWKENILKSKKHMEKWITSPNWSLIWPASHVISGIPAILAMTGEGTTEFYDWYFDWLDKAADPNSGYYLQGLIHKLKIMRKPTKRELGGAFHMYYIYEFFNRKWPYPERIVDQTLRLQHENGLWDKDVTYCIDLDGIYSLTRSCRNADGYWKEDVKKAIENYLTTVEKSFNDRKFFFQSYQNSHRLTGAINAIAECQKFYPKLVKTVKPWRQSLDKACFI